MFATGSVVFSTRSPVRPKYVVPLPSIRKYSTSTQTLSTKESSKVVLPPISTTLTETVDIQYSRTGKLYDLQEELSSWSIYDCVKRDQAAQKACTGKLYNYRDELRAMDFTKYNLPPIRNPSLS